MKKLAIALVLMCALSTPIFAGEVPITGVAAPTPPPPTTSSTASTSSTLVSVILTIIGLR